MVLIWLCFLFLKYISCYRRYGFLFCYITYVLIDIWWVFIYLVGKYLLLLFLFLSIYYFYFSFLKLPSDMYRLNQITVWNILKSSKNQTVRKLFEMTGMKIIRNDSIVKRSANAKIAKSTLDNEIQNEIMTSMNKLKEQNTLMSSLPQKVCKTVVRYWNSLNNSLPPNIFNFCRRVVIFSLNNSSNIAQ